MENRNWIWLAAAGGAMLAAYQMDKKRSSYQFRGRTVFVTGGSRGLGLVLARMLASEGARVAICARDEAEIDRACDDLEQRGGAVFGLRCDVSRRNEVESAIARIEAALGPIDVLINNAGVITAGPLDTMTVEDFEHAMGINFWGPLYASLAVLPGMRERRQGRIVNIGSVGGKVSVPHMASYSVSKHALDGLSRALRSEVDREGISVTAVSPGLMRTGSPRHATFKGQQAKEHAWFETADSLPLLSIGAERAARQILNACRRGDADIVLSLPAKAFVLFDSLFPDTNAALLAAANRLLPESDGNSRLMKGADTEKLAPHWATALGDAAARRNNEI